MIRPALLAALALLIASTPAAAQAVRGTLADAEGRAPVAGALMVLVDEAGHTRAEVLTDSAGRFLLRAPAPGRYTVRAERIGHVSTRSAAVQLEAGATREIRLAAPAEPVRLAAIAVSTQARQCTVRPRGEETALLWEEARKALRSSTATRQQYPYRFQVRRTFRELDPRTEAVVFEKTRTADSFTETPFASLPAAELAARGYFEMDRDTLVFHAPDAAVLLSDTFLDTHCFRVQPADRAHVGMVGLAFEPVRGTRTPDVHGVLWMDAGSAELRLLEYGYRNLPRSVPADLAGGRVVFQRLPNGAWIIPQWRIRMPQQGSRPPIGRVGDPALMALAEEMGEVVGIRTPAGAEVSTTAFASLSGTVYDSTRAAPIVGARVGLAGTEHAATTDSAGRYRIAGVPEGVYSLVFSHPRLDTLGYSPAPLRVRLVPPREQEQDLALPSLAAIRTAPCPSRPAGTAALAGMVAGEGGVPLPGALVTAWWQRPGESGDSARIMAVSDARGVFRLCAVPAGVQLRLQARLGGDTATAAYRVEGAGPGARDLVLAKAAVPTAVMVGAVRSARVVGRLLDTETGRPIAGATVRFSRALPEQTTDRRGTFTLTDVPEGTYGLELHHEGYGTGTSQMSVRGAAPVQFDLRVPRRTLMLETVTVEAERVRPGRHARARRRPANYVDRAAIERRPGARHVGDLVRTFPRLNVVEVAYPNNPGIIMEVRIQDRSGAPITVVLDDMPLLAHVGELLRDLSAAQVESVEYLSAADAMSVYPFATRGGVLVIYTRGTRGRAGR